MLTTLILVFLCFSCLLSITAYSLCLHVPNQGGGWGVGVGGVFVQFSVLELGCQKPLRKFGGDTKNQNLPIKTSSTVLYVVHILNTAAHGSHIYYTFIGLINGPLKFLSPRKI